MKKTDASFRLTGEDAKLLESVKQKLLHTDGKLSNLAIMRKALRKLDQELK